MRIFLFIFLFSISFFECTKRDKVPAHILSQPKMKAIVWDMMRADRFLSNFILPNDTSLNADSEKISVYKKIFLIHDVSKEKFRESFNYYKDHPSLLKTLFDSLGSQNIDSEQATRVHQGDTALPFKKLRKPLHD